MADTVFHKILRGEIPSAKIYEDADIFAFMDAFPQAKGHALIIAKNAAPDLFDMPEASLAQIIRFSRRLARAQRKVFAPAGIRVMQFNGEAAGQTVFYYHMHLLPVYAGQSEAQHGGKAADFAELQAQAAALAAALEE